jgi:hypothetical protein
MLLSNCLYDYDFTDFLIKVKRHEGFFQGFCRIVSMLRFRSDTSSRAKEDWLGQSAELIIDHILPGKHFECTLTGTTLIFPEISPIND